MTWTTEKAEQVIEKTGLPKGLEFFDGDWRLNRLGESLWLEDEQATDLINAHAERWLVEKSHVLVIDQVSPSIMPMDGEIGVTVKSLRGVAGDLVSNVGKAPTKTEAIIDAILEVSNA